MTDICKPEPLPVDRAAQLYMEYAARDDIASVTLFAPDESTPGILSIEWTDGSVVAHPVIWGGANDA